MKYLKSAKRFYPEIGLLLAIALGLLLRTWRINDLPFPPNDSELFFAYYGWSLLHFHIDEFGTYWPISFPSIGDFKYPGLVYLNILPAAIFGLSFITARFWTVLTGVLLIPLVYLFSLLIFRNKPAAVASAWLLALSPWSIILSRIGYENHTAMVFSTAGLTLLLLPYLKVNNLGSIYVKIASQANKYKKLVLSISFLLLFISSFTYAAQRLFIPMMLLFLLAYTFIKDSELLKARKVILAFFIILTAIIMLSLIPWQNRGRSAAIIYNKLEPQEANRQQELIQESGLSPTRTPVLLTRLLHNKYRILASHLLAKYANHFSPDFLFFTGDSSYERIPDTGQLLLVEIILLPLGFLALFRRNLLPLALIVPFWLLIAPISSTITTGSTINRASLMIPPLVLISGLGFSFLISIKHRLKGLVLILLLGGFVLSAVYSVYQIFVIKPIHQAWYTEVVNQEMVEDVLRIKNQYAAVVIPKDEYIFFLFYGKINPKEFISNSDIMPLNRQNPWDRVNRYSNIYFKMSSDCPESGKENVLYLCKGENIPQNSKVLEVIRYRDKVTAYTFLTFYPLSKMQKPLPTLPEGLKYMVDVESNPNRPDGMIDKNSPEWW